MTNSTTPRETQPIQSLDRGLVILEAVANSSDPMSLNELTDLVGIDRSSVFRLAFTLKRRGFLAYPTGRKDFILGPALWRLSHRYDWGAMLIRVAQEYVKQLARRPNEAVHLAIRDGRNALFIDHASAYHVIAVSGQTGEMVPLHCAAHGKALLAGLDAPTCAASSAIRRFPSTRKIRLEPSPVSRKNAPRFRPRAMPRTMRSFAKACAAWPPQFAHRREWWSARSGFPPRRNDSRLSVT